MLRCGFHLKPHISVFHVHLHCFLLPFKDKAQDQFYFGFGGVLFKSVSAIKAIIKPVSKL